MRFLIDLAEAERISNTFKVKSTEARGDLATLTTRTDPSGIFEGQAANRYREHYEQYKRAQEQMNQALEGLGKEVQWVVDQVRVIEQG